MIDAASENYHQLFCFYVKIPTYTFIRTYTVIKQYFFTPARLFGTLETFDLEAFAFEAVAFEAVASVAAFFFFKGQLISEQIHDSIQVLNPPELKDHQYWSIRKISVVLIR